MVNQDNMAEMNLPKNIRQIGTFGEKYKVYIEDFVYTYVHRFIHQRRREEPVLAAVLLGRSITQAEQEYVFISGAQKVDFGLAGAGKTAERSGAVSAGNPEEGESAAGGQAEGMRENAGQAEAVGQVESKGRNGAGGMPDTAAAKQAEFWDKVYQRIKQSFDNLEILGWYFNLDGSSLEINSELQQFFESTYKKGSRFLYFEDCLEQIDAFFVQEQHRLQRLSGYAVYYEKNPQMQQFMIEEKERLTPRPILERENAQDTRQAEAEDVVQNYRAIMNKLNEKPARRRWQPAVYVAGAAVLVIVAATAVTQIGNYQSLRTLQQTMQALSGAVSGDEEEGSSELTEEQETAAGSGEEEDSSSGSGETDNTEENSSGTAADDSSGTESADVAGVSSDNSDTGTEEASADGTDRTDTGSEAAVETGSAALNYYVVQKGDNLIAISQSLYNTTSKVDEICELNGIEDMDMIYEGQKLLLP